MPTYLYCLRSEAVDPPAGLIGIDGGTVRPVAVDGLRAWVSDVDASVAPTVERVKAHDRVCAAALDASDTPLPIRFGQTFADDAALTDAIASRKHTLRARLERVGGCVEMRVIVTHGRASGDEEAGAVPVHTKPETMGSEPSVVGPGTAFLQRLAREGRADLAREVGCEEIRHAVRTAAEPLVVAHRPCESARGVSFFPVLVRRSNVERFRAAVGDIVARERFGLSVLGPFAPYSFAGDA